MHARLYLIPNPDEVASSLLYVCARPCEPLAPCAPVPVQRVHAFDSIQAQQIVEKYICVLRAAVS